MEALVLSHVPIRLPYFPSTYLKAGGSGEESNHNGTGNGEPREEESDSDDAERCANAAKRVALKWRLVQAVLPCSKQQAGKI